MDQKSLGIGWYSAQMSNRIGSSLYLTTDGRTAPITTITPTIKQRPAGRDVELVGELAEYAGGHQKPRTTVADRIRKH